MMGMQLGRSGNRGIFVKALPSWVSWQHTCMFTYTHSN